MPGLAHVEGVRGGRNGGKDRAGGSGEERPARSFFRLTNEHTGPTV